MLLFVTILILLAFLGARYIFEHWKLLKAQDLPRKSSFPLFDSMWKPLLGLEAYANVLRSIYQSEPTAKYLLFYNKLSPIVMIRDPDLIKSVTMKNFDHFRNHRSFNDENVESFFSSNLLLLRDDRWKEVRALISPAFTSSKMKSMFRLMSDVAENVAGYLSALPANGNVLEMKDVFTRYANDVFASCAFGISIDSLSDRENRFYTLGREALDIHSMMIFKFIMLRLFPGLSKRLGVTLLSKRVMQFFQNVVSTNIRAREEQGIVRPDFIQLMMETRGRLGPGKELTIEDITAQAFAFFFGGFETTSGLLCFAVHELAANPQVQTRLRAEIDRVLEECDGSEVSFERLSSMKYLDAVVNETLRMYPVIPFTDRECSKRFELPPALPDSNGYVLEEGSHLWLPIYAIQRDPEYFDQPDTFDPDRFANGQGNVLSSGAFLPFGMGPRNCIGSRLALVETKVALFHILSRCRFEVCSKTTVPMVLKKRGVFLSAENGFWLRISRRD